MGILGSILQLERDSYYDLFHPKRVKISVSVGPGSRIKKRMQSLNYLHFKYHNLLCRGSGEGSNMHSQCRMELLMPEIDSIEYVMHIGVVDEVCLETIDDLENRIRNKDMGFGIYLGQRQFKADIEGLQSFERNMVNFSKSFSFSYMRS